MGPLKKQSEAAKKFIEYRDELKSLDINLFLLENGDIREKIADCERKEQIASDDLAEASAQLESMKEGYEKLSDDLAGLDERIESLKNRIAQGNVIKETLTGQINVLNEQINSARDAEIHFNERLESLTGSIERSVSEKEKLEAEKAANQEALTRSIDAARAQDEIVLEIQNQSEETRLQIEEMKERLIELVNVKGDIGARMERLSVLAEQSKKRREELAQSLEKYNSDKEQQEAVIEGFRKEAEKVSKETGEIEKEIKEKEAALKKADADLAFAERDLGKAREELLKSETRLESIRNITERYEGYGSSIREIMKLKEKNRGIHGVVADIIKVDKKYETAIETALGGNIQNVVTDTEATAKNVIEYLKANKLGRATFLPIKAVTGRGEFKNDDVLAEKGVLGLASSLVNVEQQYRGVVNYLLGKIVVADKIDNALMLARKYSYSLIIVTLEGELLNRGGAISGGAFKNKSNLLGRRREIDDLEKAITANREKQEDLLLKSEALNKEKDEISRELLELRTQLQESRILLNTVKINLDTAISKQREIDDTYAGVSTESREIEELEGSMNDENNALKDALQENSDENDRLKERILEMEKAREELKVKEAEELFRRQTLNAERSGLSGQNSVLVNSIIKLENDIAIFNEELEKITKSNAGSKEGIEEKQAEIADITRSIELAEAEGGALGIKLSEAENEKETLSNDHRDYLEKREQCQLRMADLDKEVFRLSQMREKLEERFETKSAYMWDEYELTYQSALELKDDSLTDAKSMRERITKLKNSIKNLGTINVAAIEEYKVVGERFEFMKTQQEDLEKAEADLIRIIKDLDKEMRRRFNTEFVKIQEEFSKVFREMFGGGQGTIELEEDIDVLDAGISIIAQPPGKKLQNMMQLSGGEKALTAIAVLFAIQNLKPSPFCLLDEIEAALDDSNIERFADYLHKLTDETQFIVITHRKGTMEATDRLYGITMQEKGVSTLISVNLEDYREEEIQ